MCTHPKRRRHSDSTDSSRVADVLWIRFGPANVCRVTTDGCHVVDDILERIMTNSFYSIQLGLPEKHGRISLHTDTELLSPGLSVIEVYQKVPMNSCERPLELLLSPWQRHHADPDVILNCPKLVAFWKALTKIRPQSSPTMSSACPTVCISLVSLV